MAESPFLAYDIRGRIGEQLDEEMAFQIGLAYAKLFKPESVVVGMDVRESSPGMSESLMEGLQSGGSDVIDIGLCGTEVVYFATSYLKTDGGIMVTASHNPRDYNGMKFVGKGSVPISKDNGLHTMRDMISEGSLSGSRREGEVREEDVWDAYTDKVLSFLIGPESLSGFKLVTDPGHGCAGPALDRISERLDLDIVRLHHEPDGSFPAGIPNPILPEMRGPVIEAVKESGADIGIAWDGDFDRCFLFDEEGAFVDGYYIVGLLAGKMLQNEPGARIIHDLRLIWNTLEIVREGGGIPIQNKTGHAFIKDRMRREDAVYGGEMSAHHYFRDFYYCDTGMVPWVLVLELMADTGKPLSRLIGRMMDRYPVSGEINRKVSDQRALLESIQERYGPGSVSIDHTDGVSIEHRNYRFNIRASNTEPLIRLNVETRGDRDLLDEKTSEILEVIDGF
ncbi:MAG: phosphomannomutase [Thermoplasmatota archaeon]